MLHQQYKKHILNCHYLQERPRAEYIARATTLEKNPITGVREPHFPQRDRIPRILSGMAAIVIMVCDHFINVYNYIFYINMNEQQ